MYWFGGFGRCSPRATHHSISFGRLVAPLSLLATPSKVALGIEVRHLHPRLRETPRDAPNNQGVGCGTNVRDGHQFHPILPSLASCSLDCGHLWRNRLLCCHLLGPHRQINTDGAQRIIGHHLYNVSSAFYSAKSTEKVKRYGNLPSIVIVTSKVCRVAIVDLLWKLNEIFLTLINFEFSATKSSRATHSLYGS